MPRKWGGNLSGHACMFSIVLDAGTRRDFDGIRLLIVNEEKKTGLDTVVFRECLNFTDIEQPCDAGMLDDRRLRESLVQQQEELAQGLQLLHSNHRRVCTLMLRFVVYHKSPETRKIELQQLDDLTFPLPKDLCIAYDRTYTLLPGTSSIVSYLYCSKTFHESRWNSVHGEFSLSIIQSMQGLYSHDLRILPLIRRSKPLPVLPPEIYQTIAWFSFTKKKRGWRRRLLSLALISKAWAHVVDLFFSGLPPNRDEDPVQAVVMARSLERSPHRGELIRDLAPWRYGRLPRGAEDTLSRFCDTMMYIVSMAPRVRDLRLGMIDSLSLVPFIRVLADLREVESLQADGSEVVGLQYTSEAPKGRRYAWAIEDIQQAISGWKRLKSVTLQTWEPRTFNREPAPMHEELPCQLESLSLADGVILGPQLLLFVSCPAPKLHTLCFNNVHGVTNREFQAFLALVAPTLEHLTVRASEISCRYDPEERALDAIMPQMAKLKHADLSGNLVTPLSIARKPLVYGPDLKFPTTLQGSKVTIVADPEVFDIVELGDALDTTGWDFVTVLWHPVLDGWGKPIKAINHSQSPPTMTTPPSHKANSTETDTDATFHANTKDFNFVPIPHRLRYNPKKPFHFGLLLNLSFGFASTFVVANLYYCQPLLIQFSDSFGVSYNRVSRIPTLIQAGYATGLLLISPLGDLVRRRQLLLILTVLSTTLSIGLAITNSLVTFETLSFLVGMFSVSPQILLPLAADLAPPERRASAISVVLSGLLFGILVARVLAGVIAEFTTWRVVYYVAIGTQSAVLVGIYLMLPDYPAKNDNLTYWDILFTMAKFAFTEPLLIQASLINIASSACFSSFWVTLTFLLGGPPYNYSTLVIGLFGLVGMFGVAMGPFLGKLIDKLVPCVQTAAGGINIGAVVIATIGLDVFRQTLQVSLSTAVFGISQAARSRLNAIMILSLFIGQVLGTAVGTKVFVTYGWRAGAALNMGWYGWQLFLLFLRGPHCQRFTWFGYEGGLEARKPTVGIIDRSGEKDAEQHISNEKEDERHSQRGET
ncbi:hypothetical protein DXG01_016121 [Tephrocybe rancida]|nr:hypothetical protein DXG01_016121 [Tephrocybe rancida]